MKQIPILFLALLVTYGQCSSAQSQTVPVAKPNDAAPLNLVIEQVKAALLEYQTNRGGGADTLPPLSSAEFDFKTTTAMVEGGTVNLLIFKFGTSHEDDAINDVTYTYSLPKPTSAPGTRAPRKKPPLLRDQLAQAIQSAAAAVKTAGPVGDLKFSKLTVNLSYGVKWDINGSEGFQFSLVTVGVNGDANKNTVQAVKITFGQ